MDQSLLLLTWSSHFRFVASFRN